MADEFEVLKELKRLEKINGSVREVNVVIESSGFYNEDPAVYGSALDQGRNPKVKPGNNYHFSDGNGMEPDYFSNPKIRKSIDGMVSGKRRPAEELDEITAEMARMAANHVVEFIDSGAHRNYQPWKGTSSDNLYETGRLRDSIVGIAKNKEKIIWRGR